MNRPSLVIGLSATALLTVACMTWTKAAPTAQDAKIRVMTYNIQWLAENENPGRISNLKSVIYNIKPDIIATQEIYSKAALEQIFNPGEWNIYMANNPDEEQELAVVVRKKFKVIESGLLFPNKNLDDAFPGNRDVMRVVIELSNGEKVAVMSTHMKSRSGGRLTTDPRRALHAQYLADYLKRSEVKNNIVMGDFNDYPDDVCANILESGDKNAKAGPNKEVLMHNVTEEIATKDYCSIGLANLFRGQDISPIVPGAHAENARLRGRDYRFPDDVKVTQSFFDQILVSMPLKDLVSGPATVYSKADALRGRNGRVQVFADGTVDYQEKGDRASDHAPVYVDLKLAP